MEILEEPGTTFEFKYKLCRQRGIGLGMVRCSTKLDFVSETERLRERVLIHDLFMKITSVGYVMARASLCIGPCVWLMTCMERA